MQRPLKLLSLAIATAFCAPVLAQPPGGGGPGGGGGDTGATSPTDALQEELDLLTARVIALELDQHARPNQIVAGRRYCVTITNINLRDNDTTAQNVNDLYTQFSTFTSTAEFTENNTVKTSTLAFGGQRNKDQVLFSFATTNSSPPVSEVAYNQTGSQLKLDPTGTDPTINETLSVSADGSLLVGNRLGDFDFGSNARSLTAGTSIWREYRPDLGDVCDATIPPGVTPRAL